MIVHLCGQVDVRPAVSWQALAKTHSNIVHLRLGIPKGLFPLGLLVKILKALLPSSILPSCLVHLNVVDLTTLSILGKRYKI